MTSDRSTHTPECPRCGYEQTGAVSAFPNDRCPMIGLCTECGHGFAWCDVLSPKVPSQRLFESAKRRLAGAWWRTGLLALRPARLWSTIEMHFAFAPLRLMFFVTTFGGGVWLFCASLIQLDASLYTGSSLPLSWSTALWPWREHDWFAPRSFFLSPGPPPVLLGLALFAAMPCTYLLLPQTLGRAKVKRSHLIRVGGYALVGVPVTLLLPVTLWVLAESWLGWLWRYSYFGSDQPGFVAWGTLACAIAWLGWTWRCASRFYLKLPRPGLIAVTLLLASALLLTTITVVAALSSRGVLRWLMNTIA